MGQGKSKASSRYSLLSEHDQNFVLDRLDESDTSEDELFAINPQRDKPATASSERWYVTLAQIFFPFLLAGLGMVAAGIVLDIVQHWTVFIQITELFILVPALLGLKGNLEMTLASRLSTAANLGKMDSLADCLKLVTCNLALIQCQAIVVGFLASLTGLGLGYFKNGILNLNHGLLMCASSVVTASLASFVLGLVMVSVIVTSRQCNINPDNVATPIAASLGDLTTLALLSWISDKLWADMVEGNAWLSPLLICLYLLVTPACCLVAWRHSTTRDVLLHGWTPVLLSMLLSSGGGLILEYAVDAFNGIAVFQPVMNGVGGNLVAVQASRMSTYLHTTTSSSLPSCVSPAAALCDLEDDHSHTARLLLLLVVPGHLVFTLTISYAEAGHTSPTPVFLAAYLLAALLQVALLLYICRVVVFLLWSWDMDPDNCAIPYLTALGDLLGGAFLALAFLVLHLAGQMIPSRLEVEASTVTYTANITSSTPSLMSSSSPSSTATSVTEAANSVLNVLNMTYTTLPNL